MLRGYDTSDILWQAADQTVAFQILQPPPHFVEFIFFFKFLPFIESLFVFLNILLQRIMNFSNASIISQVLSLSQTGCHDDVTMTILQYRNVAIQ